MPNYTFHFRRSHGEPVGFSVGEFANDGEQ
jgi:hypothetical protein